MDKNEIRLRREQISQGRIARHRNYSELMRIYDRDMRLKRVLRVFTYFLVILFLLIILLIIWRWEARQKERNSTPSQPHKSTTQVQINQRSCSPVTGKSHSKLSW